MSVDVVVALHTEARCLPSTLIREPVGAASLRVRVAGAGAESAERSARAAVAAGARALLSWGFAGALDPRLRSGTILLPLVVLAADGARFPVDADWHRRLLASLTPRVPLSTGAIGEARHPLLGTDAKAGYREAFAVAAVDMESAAIARVAHEAGIAFAAVRAVTDTVTRNVPASALAALGPEGDLRPRALLAVLARSPRDLPPLITLVPGFMLARRALRRAGAAAGASGALLLAASPASVPPARGGTMG